LTICAAQKNIHADTQCEGSFYMPNYRWLRKAVESCALLSASSFQTCTITKYDRQPLHSELQMAVESCSCCPGAAFKHAQPQNMFGSL